MLSEGCQKDKMTERLNDRKTKRQKDEITERRNNRKTKRQKDKKTERQKDRKTKRQKDKKTKRRKDEKTERRKDDEQDSEDIQAIYNELLRSRKGGGRALASRSFDLLNSMIH